MMSLLPVSASPSAESRPSSKTTLTAKMKRRISGAKRDEEGRKEQRKKERKGGKERKIEMKKEKRERNKETEVGNKAASAGG